MKLVLFLTRGMSLRAWKDCGLLLREMALYQNLQRNGIDVALVTYGDSGDLHFREKFPGISIHCNRWGLPLRLYEILLPWLHRNVFRRADLFKTNQMNGAEVALRCALHFKKPLIARCGYLWSEFAKRQYGADSPAAKRSAAVESQVFALSRRIVVTTEAMRSNIVQRFPQCDDKTLVIPNYVDTDLFAPHNHDKSSFRRLCYVGRLDQDQKNIRSLLAAVDGFAFDLDIIGDGPLRDEVASLARRNSRISLRGKVPHDQLPGLLNQSAAFVLPSFYEGHPKALIEAMACGLPVIASNSPGIASVIRHGETGWLCGTSKESIRDAIKTISTNPVLCQRLGSSAREYAVTHFSLDRIVGMELELYCNLLKEQVCTG